MKKSFHKNNFDENTLLSQEEASNLAQELKSKLAKGEMSFIDKRQINKIIAGLGDSRGLLRRTFSESLGVIGEKVLPELRKVLLNSKNVNARRAAAKTLRLIGNSASLPDLLEALLNDEDPVVQGSAAGAMAVFGEEAVQYLLNILESPSSSEMQCGLACWGLCFVGAEGSYAIKEAAKSKNAKVRSACIAALGEQIQFFSDADAKEILTDALRDESKEVQIEAIKLAASIEDNYFNIDLLASKLNDTHPEIRKQCVLAIMKLNSTNHIANIKELLLKEKDKEVISVLKLCINRLE